MTHAEPSPPVLLNHIPLQRVTEQSTWGPIYLTDFIHSPEESGKCHFFAELTNSQALPEGVMCTSDGILTGIPAKQTAGHYDIQITVKNDADTPLLIPVTLIIREALTSDTINQLTALKNQVWEAIGDNVTIPELEALFDRPITDIEIAYLLERFATLTIWDVYNLDPPNDEKITLNLKGMSEHYIIYDRGSCLVAAPKELFSHARSLEDALKTARAMAGEAFNRGWTLELTGFPKLARAAWVELQVLSAQTQKSVDILRYTPTGEDYLLYEQQAKRLGLPSKTILM